MGMKKTRHLRQGAGKIPSRARGRARLRQPTAYACLRTSAPSRLNLGVEPLQLDPCFLDGELPIDGSLLLVDSG